MFLNYNTYLPHGSQILTENLMSSFPTGLVVDVDLALVFRIFLLVRNVHRAKQKAFLQAKDCCLPARVGSILIATPWHRTVYYLGGKLVDHVNGQPVPWRV